MKVLGIIAEYNPYHNGHSLHIKKSKKLTGADYIIAVMSSNFVQRGEPAIADKWTRTKMALSDGIDLVLELPTLYSTSSAEFFAASAIKLLQDTGIVTMLSFGSESGTLLDLSTLASAFLEEKKTFSSALQQELKQGVSFPAARMNAFKKSTGNKTLSLYSPNDILGVEYLKALKRLSSSIQPFTVKREKAQYHSLNTTDNIASATALRHLLSKQENADLTPFIPSASLSFFLDAIKEEIAPVYPDALSPFLNYCLRTQSLNDISQILDIKEGLENRIYAVSEQNDTFHKITEAVKTKRYPYTMIQRALLHIILHIKKEEFLFYNQKGFCPYLRVLGFRKESRFLLSSLSQQAKLPVITNTKKISSFSSHAQSFFELEKKATDLYFLMTPKKDFHPYSLDYKTPVQIL